MNFIRDFQLSNFGLEIWHALVILGVLILVVTLINRSASVFTPSTAIRIRKTMTIFIGVIYYGIMLFLILNAFLNSDHIKLILLIFSLFFLEVKNRIESLYKKYDNFVDRMIRKILG